MFRNRLDLAGAGHGRAGALRPRRRSAARASMSSTTSSTRRSTENTQTLAAKAAVRFVPLDDNINSATFELNNALNVSHV